VLLYLTSCTHTPTHICTLHLYRDQKGWEFHFHEVIVLGCALYAYTWVVPAVLSGLLWWRGNNHRHSLLELLSVYGYSIGIFIPITVGSEDLSSTGIP